MTSTDPNFIFSFSNKAKAEALRDALGSHPSFGGRRCFEIQKHISPIPTKTPVGEEENRKRNETFFTVSFLPEVFERFFRNDDRLVKKERPAGWVLLAFAQGFIRGVAAGKKGKETIRVIHHNR